PGGEPVVVVAIDDDRRIVRDARAGHQLFVFVARDDVALHGVAKLRTPVPRDRARHMALVVCFRIHVDFDNAHIRIIRVVRDPRGRDQYFRMNVVRHSIHLILYRLWYEAQWVASDFATRTLYSRPFAMTAAESSVRERLSR